MSSLSSSLIELYAARRILFVRYIITSLNSLTPLTVILKFKERTSQKIIISNKSILTRFKLFALDDSGYIYNWKCARPGIIEEILRKKKKVFISILNSSISTSLNPT